MFLEEIILWIAENACALILHLSAKNAFPKPLAAEEEHALIEAMQAGDIRARDRLIEHNLRLVAHIAKKYARNPDDADDLISIGSIGLMKAVHTFRPDSGKLTTYASRCIENEIRMHLRAIRKLRNTSAMSDAVSRDKEGNEIQISDLLGTDKNMVHDEVARKIEGQTALKLIDTLLDAREAQVIRMRYGLLDGEFYPQHAVADRMGISRSYVSRIEKKALQKLKNHME